MQVTLDECLRIARWRTKGRSLRWMAGKLRRDHHTVARWADPARLVERALRAGNLDVAAASMPEVSDPDRRGALRAYLEAMAGAQRRFEQERGAVIEQLIASYL